MQISKPTWYIPGIYPRYTKYITCICRPQAYPFDIPSPVQMGLFSTFFYYDMPKICWVHSMNVLDISKAYHYKKKVWNKPICTRLGRSKGYAWGLHIHRIN